MCAEPTKTARVKSIEITFIPHSKFLITHSKFLFRTRILKMHQILLNCTEEMKGRIKKENNALKNGYYKLKIVRNIYAHKL